MAIMAKYGSSSANAIDGCSCQQKSLHGMQNKYTSLITNLDTSRMIPVLLLQDSSNMMCMAWTQPGNVAIKNSGA